ncbi:GNAT family N-acetyltransferase [Roseitranquillus sediminis]|uniref:GNAT family N-acetyltransferase n=1 Tax=Roseitranquillus sediminis TaxID=2809051 RepID=UPI001D0C859C|nr:GNAT family N-acetyltransferase [Roseitranquillus sediminis]MBM9594135.1 GNAT family N-acetyltransferase [Roseitranquillus sediminis]
MAEALTIEIGSITTADAGDWRRLWSGYLDFYGARVGSGMLQTSFERLTGSDPRDFRGLIARIGGRAAGLAHFLFHRHMWRVENVCYLQDLWTEPEFRGRGVARRLMEAVYDEADRARAPAVWWLTAHDNATARRLYDRVWRLSPFVKYDRA